MILSGGESLLAAAAQLLDSAAEAELAQSDSDASAREEQLLATKFRD